LAVSTRAMGLMLTCGHVWSSNYLDLQTMAAYRKMASFLFFYEFSPSLAYRAPSFFIVRFLGFD